MPLTTLLASFFAAMLYILSPGPAVLALIGIGAARGRAPAIQFVGGHLIGDTLWCGLAIFALVSAEVIDPRIFGVIALICGGYLGYLGWKGVTATSVGSADNVIGAAPLKRGVLFGLTNPKSYPVATAMFSALFAGVSGGLTFAAMPALIAIAFAGFLAGNAIIVWLVGTPLLRRLYLNHAVWIIRTTGVLFLAFAAHAVWEAVPRLIGAG